MSGSSGIKLLPLPIVFARGLSYRWVAFLLLLTVMVFTLLPLLVGSGPWIGIAVVGSIVSLAILAVIRDAVAPAKISISQHSIAVMQMSIFGLMKKPFERPILEFNAVESIYIEANKMLSPPYNLVTHQLIRIRSKATSKRKWWKLYSSYDDVNGDIRIPLTTLFSFTGDDYQTTAKQLALQLGLPYEHKIINPLDFKNGL